GPAVFDQYAGQISLVQALHGDDGEAVCGIEPTEGRIAEPLVSACKGDFGIRVIGLDRIINDENITATSGQSASDRGGKPISPQGSLEFGLGALLRIQPSAGKDALVKG